MDTVSLHPSSDFLIRLGENLYKASSVVLCSKSFYFERENKIRSIKSRELVIKSPFPHETLKVLEWLHNGNTVALISIVSSFQKIFEVYAVGKVFGIKKNTNFRNVLLSVPYDPSREIEISEVISEALCKELIDLQFVLQVLRNIRLDYMSQEYRIGIILEWLGEKYCHTSEDIRNLQNSSEYLSLNTILTSEFLVPFHSEVLKKIYPIGAKSIELY